MSMQPAMPNIAGECNDYMWGIAARFGVIVGYSRSRVVWRFGFLPDSTLSRAFGRYDTEFTFALATPRGKILATHRGFALNLPRRFINVINADLKRNRRTLPSHRGRNPRKEG